MFTPENIKKLTNVSIVTYKTGDTKFELAIYPNTLFDYKKGLIKKEVMLHTDTVFSDVKKGLIAPQSTLRTHFKKHTQDETVEYILKNGSEKINDKSRNIEIERRENEICNIVASKMLYKKKKLTHEAIKQLIKSIGYNIDYKRCAKIQANEICKALDSKLDCEKMKIRVQFTNGVIEEMDGTQFMMKKEEWKRDNVSYTVKYDDEVEEEEIC